MQISLILATYNRASILEATLSFLAGQLTRELSCEIIIGDNGNTDNTANVIKHFLVPPITGVHLRTEVPGKCEILNRALDIAQGDLVVFTDDDIIPADNWLQELFRAKNSYPKSAIFCGPIYPEFPQDTPAWLTTHPYSVAAYARFDPGCAEGVLPEELIPFGPNFAVRRTALAGQYFRTDLGPSLRNGPLSYDDTDFISRLRETYPDIAFIPTAYVRHRITPNQVTTQWFLERAFNFGRSVVAARRYPSRPRAIMHSEVSESDRHMLILEEAIRANFYLGQEFQMWLFGCHSFDHFYSRELRSLSIPEDSLSKLAKVQLSEHLKCS